MDFAIAIEDDPTSKPLLNVDLPNKFSDHVLLSPAWYIETCFCRPIQFFVKSS